MDEFFSLHHRDFLTANLLYSPIRNKPRSNLLCLAVWVAAVVDEARRVAFLRCVEDLIAVEGHEVEVVARAVDLGPSPELSVLQHLTHVLNDEITPVDDKMIYYLFIISWDELSIAHALCWYRFGKTLIYTRKDQQSVRNENGRFVTGKLPAAL